MPLSAAVSAQVEKVVLQDLKDQNIPESRCTSLDDSQDFKSAPMLVATSTSLQTKQGGKESEESESDRESDSDSEGEGGEDDEGRKLARIVSPLNTRLHVTESVATEETLQSTHKIKTGLNPIKDPVVALTPPASGNFK